jgi:DNA-binding NarL/FixJ family response regulator
MIGAQYNGRVGGNHQWVVREEEMSISKPPGNIRVVLCDDHELFRDGIAEMLTTADELEVVGEGNTHERAVTVVSETRPDVVLLDLEMPGGAAEESLRKMLALPQPPRVIIVTMHDEPRLIRRFIGIGASAYLPKSTSLEELLATVRNVAASPLSPSDEGGAWGMPQRVLKDSDGHADGLSEREVEILLHAARGMSNQQIAASLHLSEATVKRHLANIYIKLGVKSRAEATQKALANGWISSFELLESYDNESEGRHNPQS